MISEGWRDRNDSPRDNSTHSSEESEHSESERQPRRGQDHGFFKDIKCELSDFNGITDPQDFLQRRKSL